MRDQLLKMKDNLEIGKHKLKTQIKVEKDDMLSELCKCLQNNELANIGLYETSVYKEYL